MSYYKDIAVALWKPDYEKIKEKYAELVKQASAIHKEETPDETYIILYWQQWDAQPGKDSKMDTFFEEIRDIRHSILTIAEDGNILKDVETCDSNGCDEEFEEILNWKADICIWGEESSPLQTDGSGLY